MGVTYEIHVVEFSVASSGSPASKSDADVWTTKNIGPCVVDGRADAGLVDVGVGLRCSGIKPFMYLNI